jgi:hypothetical protein
VRLTIVVPNGWVERPVTFVHLLSQHALVQSLKKKRRRKKKTSNIKTKKGKIKKFAAHHRCTQRMG